jgi:diguanylate cyclase (GGDEF)-like protein/PAS domain S-box-containing protein
MEQAILLVEGNATDALIVKHALRKNFSVQHARTAQEGQELLKRHTFAGVVLDYSLAETNGLALQQWIIRQGLELPVIVISDEGDDRIAAKAFKQGAYDYIVKSEESLSALGAVVHQMLQRHELEQRAQILQQIVENASEAIITMKEDGQILTANRAVEMTFLYRPEEVVGQPFTLLFPEDRPEEHARGMLKTSAAGHSWQGELPARRKDGSVFPAQMSCSVLRDRAGRTRCLIGIVRDVTERRQFLDQLQHLSVTDNLTGLYNHRFFHQRLRYEFARARRYREQLGCIMIDVDFFKTVNDTYGHLLGDEVLKSLAGIVSRATRSVDLVARYGGEEFAILLPSTDLEGAARCAEHIWKSVGTTEIGTRQGALRLTICAGVSALAGDMKDEEELCRRADAALLIAKQRGRNNVCVWDCAFLGPDAQPQVLQGQNFAELRANLLRLIGPAKRRYLEALRPLLESWCRRNPLLERRMANVAIFAMELGRAARMRPEELEALHNATLFHVIASAAAGPEPPGERRDGPRRAGAAPEPANAAEELASGSRILDLEIECLRHCRERYDGAGVPDGLTGKEIPLGARVLAVADACDTLISERAEEAGSMDEEIVDGLRRLAGKELDPDLIALFVKAHCVNAGG